MNELQLVTDFCRGTEHLRSCEPVYLARFPREEPVDFETRRKQSLIFNDTQHTLEQLVGRVLRKPPEFEQDVPELIRGRKPAASPRASVRGAALEGWAENIDLTGKHWQVFAKDVFTDALRDGHAFIYVDMPPKVKRADGRQTSLDDERRAGHRPYWVKYQKSQALNWAMSVVNGQPQLTQITLRERTLERAGRFGEVQVTRYRVLTPGKWELHKETTDSNGNVSIVPDGTGETSLDYIPLVPVYAKQTGFLESFPPLEPLAQIECSRYNLYSDYRTGIHLTIPILCLRTDNADAKFQTTGWTTYVRTEKDGGLAYAESSGNGLAYFEKELAALDQRMAIFGLMLLTRPAGPRTATEIQSGDLKSDAPLVTAAQNLHDGLELALKYTADYAKLGSGGSVKLGFLTEKIPTLTPQALQALTGLAERGLLDKQTLLEILKHDGWLLDSQDVQELLKRLEHAEQQAADHAAALFNRGGLPLDGA